MDFRLSLREEMVLIAVDHLIESTPEKVHQKLKEVIGGISERAAKEILGRLESKGFIGQTTLSRKTPEEKVFLLTSKGARAIKQLDKARRILKKLTAA